MNMWIERKPYHLTDENVKKIEEMKGAVFMGHFCTKSPKGYWHEQPVDVFYQPNPKTELGHTHYFGILYQMGRLFITDASTAWDDPVTGITGVLADDGEVIVSRYRHDYQERKNCMIDGGRDYTKSFKDSKYIKVTVEDSEFNFAPWVDLEEK